MSHILDRPVWSALTTRHADLAEGDERAKRYPHSIVPFAVARDEAPESVAALGELCEQGVSTALLQADPIVMPSNCVASLTADAVQMVAARPLETISDQRVSRLDEADAVDMLDLALLTKPGPFTLRALSLGEFWGIRQDGRLIAMVGERMRQPRYAEISGLCVHPELQGRGLGRLLLGFMTARIFARGENPYLHAYATNKGAIALYESLGFELRQRMHVAIISRA